MEDRKYTRRIATTREVEASILLVKSQIENGDLWQKIGSTRAGLQLQTKQKRPFLLVKHGKTQWKHRLLAKKTQLHAQDRNYRKSRNVNFYW